LGTKVQTALQGGQAFNASPVRSQASPAGAITRPERSETGVWVGILAIIMMFAALTSAMIVRQGAAQDWKHFELPRILYVTTLILLGSSYTLSIACKKLAIVAKTPNESTGLYKDGMDWMYVTLALGILFVVGQVLGWRTLSREGVFLASNPSSSFFYVFTATHAVHLLGGVAALLYMIRKLDKTNETAQTTGLRALAIYWHFMDGLWLYLFVLLLART
jgi:cytochrome c oxidase subunit III